MIDEDKGIATELIIFPLSEEDLPIISDKDTLAMPFDSFGTALIDAIAILEYLYTHVK